MLTAAQPWPAGGGGPAVLGPPGPDPPPRLSPAPLPFPCLSSHVRLSVRPSVSLCPSPLAPPKTPGHCLVLCPPRGGPLCPPALRGDPMSSPHRGMGQPLYPPPPPLGAILGGPGGVTALPRPPARVGGLGGHPALPLPSRHPCVPQFPPFFFLGGDSVSLPAKCFEPPLPQCSPPWRPKSGQWGPPRGQRDVPVFMSLHKLLI